MDTGQQDWDVFISYASEDREAVAAPLAQVLSGLGVRVWFDQTALKVGDSLRECIDDGLAHCRFGVVVLSHAFFGKRWPGRELNGLVQREMAPDGQNVLLPIWYNVDVAVVRGFSPPLADRVALPWSEGVYSVASEILSVVRPDLTQDFRERLAKVVELKIVRSGKDLAAVVAGVEVLQFFNDSAQTRDESQLIAEFLQQMQDWSDYLGDVDIGERIEAEYNINDSLSAIRKAGWSVYSHRSKREATLMGERSIFDVGALAVVRGEPSAVILDGDRLIVPRIQMSGV